MWIIVIKEDLIAMGYGKDSRDDDNSTQDINLHPLIRVNAIRFLKETFV